MTEVIVLDDADDCHFGTWPVCKRQRLSRDEIGISQPDCCVVHESASRKAVPDTSDDAILAMLLQAEEDKHIATKHSNVGSASPTNSFYGDLAPTDDISEVTDAPIEISDSQIHFKGSSKAVGRGTLAQSRRVAVAKKSVDVKLMWDHGPPIFLKLRPDAMLATVFSNASVKKRLRASCGMQNMANPMSFNNLRLHRGLPEPKVFDFALAECTSAIGALGCAGGVLRVRQDRVSNPGDSGDPGDPSGPPHRVKKAKAMRSQPLQMSGAQHAGDFDTVEIVRLRKPGDDFGSPVALVKNFNRDRGVLLARLTGMREMVEMAPEARAALTQNVRSELDSYAKGRSATGEVQRASNRVLDMVQDAVKDDLPANSALRHRTDYASTAVLVYDKGQTLPRHIDNCGHWVVLFSFGCTVDFHAGGKSVKFESGDVLVFNGSKRDAVMHGIDKMHPRPTFRGKACKLPAELEYLDGCRVSFQARQGDAL